MENFELIDNLFQITVLLCTCVAAGILAIRHRNRSLLILSLAYACFAMGTIYYVLYLAASILCGRDLMAGCVAFLPVRTDFANGGDEVPLFAPCRSHRGGHCGGCFS